MPEDQWSDDFQEPPKTPRRPDRDQWDEGPPAKAGMSSGMKAFLIVVAILGTCCVLCCGVGAFFIYSFYPKVSEAPADVDAARNEIAKIDLPAGFKPVRMVKMDNMALTMIAVEYEDPAIDGRISLAEMRVKMGQAAQNDEAIRGRLESGGFQTGKPLSNIKRETKTIKVNGQDCSFTFARGNQQGTKKKMREVSGAFDGPHGPAWISIEMDDAKFNEDAIVKMLEGIK
jgi:hypothetical protein